MTSIENNHMQFADNETSLGKFYSEFGVYDEASGVGIDSFNAIAKEEKAFKEDVNSELKAGIQSILQFKNLAKVREYENLRAVMKAELEAEAKAAEDAAAAQAAQTAPVTTERSPKAAEEEAHTDQKPVILDQSSAHSSNEDL